MSMCAGIRYVMWYYVAVYVAGIQEAAGEEEQIGSARGSREGAVAAMYRLRQCGG